MPHFRLGLLAFVGAATLGMTLAHPGQVLWMDENMPWSDEWQEAMDEEWQEPEEEWNDLPSEEEPWHEDVWEEPMPEEEWNNAPAEEEQWPEEVWQDDAEEPWEDLPAEEEQWPEEPWEERNDWGEEPMEEVWQEQADDVQEEPVMEEVWHDAAGSEPCEDCGMGGWSSSSEGSEPAECEGVPDGEPCSDGMCIGGYCIGIAYAEESSSTSSEIWSESSSAPPRTHGVSRCVHRPTDWCNDNDRCYSCRDAKDETECARRGCVLDFETATCVPQPEEGLTCDDPAECLSCSGRSAADCSDASCMLEEDMARDFYCAPKPERCPLACLFCSYENISACPNVQDEIFPEFACKNTHKDCSLKDGVCESRFKHACETREQQFIRDHIDGTEIRTWMLPEESAPKESTDAWSVLFGQCTSMEYVKEGASNEAVCDAFLRTTSACIKALPSCSTFSIKNAGCRTFKNYGQVEAWAEDLRLDLPEGVEVSVQGEQAMTGGAYSCSTSTTITVDCDNVKTALPPCHSTKDLCYDPEHSPAVDCIESLTNVKRKEICCSPPPLGSFHAVKDSTELGHWAKGDTCPSEPLALCLRNGEFCDAWGIHTHRQCLSSVDMETVLDASCCRISPYGDRVIFQGSRNCPAFTCKAQGSAMTCGGATTEAVQNAITTCGTEQQTECERNGGMLKTVCTDATLSTGYLWGCTVERSCTLQCITDRVPADGGDPGGGWDD